MRRKEKEISDSKEVEEILRKNELCRIAFAFENEAYVVPMNYGFQEHAIYLHSSGEGKKIEMMHKNPQVCFEVTDTYALKPGDSACTYGSKFRSVIGRGLLSVVHDAEQKRVGLVAIMRQHTGQDEWEFDEKMVARTTVLRLAIREMTGKKSGFEEKKQ